MLRCACFGNSVIFQLVSSLILNNFPTWLSWIRVFSKSLRSLWSICEASSQSSRGQHWILHPSFKSCSLPLIHASAYIQITNTGKNVSVMLDIVIHLYYMTWIWECVRLLYTPRAGLGSIYSVLFGQIFTTIWWFLWQWQSKDMTKTDFGPNSIVRIWAHKSDAMLPCTCENQVVKTDLYIWTNSIFYFFLLQRVISHIKLI